MRAKKNEVRRAVYNALAGWDPIEGEELSHLSRTDKGYPVWTIREIAAYTKRNSETIRTIVKKGVMVGLIDHQSYGHYVLTDDGRTYHYFLEMGII